LHQPFPHVLQLCELQLEHPPALPWLTMDLPSIVALKTDMTRDIFSLPHFSQTCLDAELKPSKNSLTVWHSPH